MAKIIVSVGFEFPARVTESVSTNSDRSLLDADIIIFRGDLDAFPSETNVLREQQTYKGDRWISEEGSFALKRAVTHWRSQLKIAYETGKTIIILLAPFERVFVDSGERQYSGTGRSRRATVMLSEVHNYQFLPITLQVTAAVGRGIKQSADLEFLLPLWNLLKSHFEYQVMIEGKFKPLLLTRTGDKVVGGMIAGKGTMILLPDLVLPQKFLFTESGNWSSAAKQFGHQFLTAIAETDNAIRVEGDLTPAPDWASAPEFQFLEEQETRVVILSLDEKIELLTAQRQKEEEKLKEVGSLRSLLYEKGPRLESAVQEALRILGFQVDTFKTGEHEFDAVFQSAEGRFIGEVEGRDQKWIAIGKLSQLERNIQEDYARDEVETHAKGVLFGNAERILPRSQRGPYFTEKVLSGARRSKISLVCTPDLFDVIRYLKNTPDMDFAQKCREAIANCDGGIVAFPKHPNQMDDSELLPKSKS